MTLDVFRATLGNLTVQADLPSRSHGVYMLRDSSLPRLLRPESVVLVNTLQQEHDRNEHHVSRYNLTSTVHTYIRLCNHLSSEERSVSGARFSEVDLHHETYLSLAHRLSNVHPEKKLMRE